MKINKKIRIIVLERLIKNLSEKLKNCNPYGYEDCQKIYEDLSYFEDKLNLLKN